MYPSLRDDSSSDSPVSARSNKVKTGVHPHINLFLALGLLLLTHIVFMLIVQKIYDG
jgi:hypothetical protein